jgi:uncharacterized protein (TIGR02996 family)
MGTREQLLAGIVSDPHDVALRLVYADWLEENGDTALAGFIRARCALDGQIPDPEEYPTLIERSLESLAGQRKPEFRLPPGFTWGCWWDSTTEEWWSDSHDMLEGGLLSFVRTKVDDAAPDVFIDNLAELVRATPVRGIAFGSNWGTHLPAILASSASRHLRRIALEGPSSSHAAVSAVQAVAASPVTPTLTRLELGHAYHPLNDADAMALAAAPFDRLERLDVLFNACSAASQARLLDAPWFRRLRRLLIGFNPACAEDGARRLGGMPALHTLVLWIPDDPVLIGLGDAQELPELRRLVIHCANLRGDQSVALGRLKAPKLIELWLRNCNLGKADVKALASSPLFAGLRVLTFDSDGLTHTALDAVAASPCAKVLRILRIRHAAFRSLARSALARPGAFPALTTLFLSSPFGSAAKVRDTAAFLAALDTPTLRHLTLEYCDFDDACAEAITANPSFAGLTQLVIRGNDALRPATFRAFLQSPNLRNLTVLQLWDCKGGSGAEVLADEAILPRLVDCTLYGVTEKVAAALSGRPVVRCTT